MISNFYRDTCRICKFGSPGPWLQGEGLTNNYCLYMYAYTQSIFLVYFAFFLLLVFYLLKAPASDVTPSQGISFGDILGQCFCKFS